MPRSITLTRQAQSTITQNGLTAYRIVITATLASGTGLSNEVFLHLRLPLDPANIAGGQADVFQGVCSPVDIAEVPINNPASGDDPAWCRKASVDLMLRSSALAAETWSAIIADVQGLLTALKLTDALTVIDVEALSDA